MDAHSIPQCSASPRLVASLNAPSPSAPHRYPARAPSPRHSPGTLQVGAGGAAPHGRGSGTRLGAWRVVRRLGARLGFGRLVHCFHRLKDAPAAPASRNSRDGSLSQAPKATPPPPAKGHEPPMHSLVVRRGAVCTLPHHPLDLSCQRVLDTGRTRVRGESRVPRSPSPLYPAQLTTGSRLAVL